MGEEEEEITAELAVPSACPEAVGIDGDAAAAQLGHGHGAVRVRVSCSGEKREGEREQGGFGVLLILQGGAMGRGSSRGGHGAARPWRQWFHCGARKKEGGEREDDM